MKAFYYPPYPDSKGYYYPPPSYPAYDPSNLPKEYVPQPYYYPPQAGYPPDIAKDTGHGRPPWLYQIPPMYPNFPVVQDVEAASIQKEESAPVEKAIPKEKNISPGMICKKILNRRSAWPNQRL